MRGLVGAWIFDQTSGNRVPDRSGNGNHATLINTSASLSWVRSEIGQALRMTGGTSDRVDLGTIGPNNPLAAPYGLTIMAHVKVLSTGTGIFQAIVDKSTGATSDEPLNGYGLNYSRLFNTIQFAIDNKNQTGNFGPKTIENRWARVIGTYQPEKKAAVFIDRGEELSANQLFAKTIPTVAAPMAIGNGSGGARSGMDQLNGDIRSVFIFNRPLTDQEIANFDERAFRQRPKRFAFASTVPIVTATYAQSAIIDGD